MSLYKYMKFEDLKRVLVEGTIRFTQPGAFNDPFEMVPELYVPDTVGTTEVNLSFSTTAPRRTPSVHELQVDFESDYCNDRNSRLIRASLDKAIGILCLSRNSSSLLMWSHYADAYSGAVIEFDESHEFLRGHFEVDYREHRPKIDIGVYISNADPIPIAELCVKPRAWEHEAEVRVVRNLVDCRPTGGHASNYPVYVMDLPADCIRSVTLGERMTVPHQREVWEVVKNLEISLYLDAISNWGYDFRRENIKIVGLKNPFISPRTAHIFSEQDGTNGEIARFQLGRKELSEMVNDIL